jgi:hypothetical protein
MIRKAAAIYWPCHGRALPRRARSLPSRPFALVLATVTGHSCPLDCRAAACCEAAK